MTAAVDVSPIDAAQQALQHTRRQLFPFRFERWLALGFVAFLDQCGRTQTGFSTGFPGGPSPEGGERAPGEVLSQAAAWLGAHVTLVVVLAAVFLVITLCITALILWINSRGVFMYVDAVATGRSDVSRPWREHAAKADSYFAWSFGLSIGALTGGIVLLVTAALVVFQMARGQSGFDFGPGVVVALAVLAGLLLIFVLSFALASLALRDFVAPIQVRTGLSCGACIGLFLGLLRVYPGAFVVYLLLKIVLYMVVAFAVTVAACVTCCCALIPVVTQTLLQPVFYFERAWPLFLLRPMGYDLVTAAAGVPFARKEEPPDVQAPEPR